MTPPMLRVSSQEQPRPKTTAHLLPCRVHYDGPVEPAQSYWSPTEKDDGTRVSYFRGRQLHGKAVKLPDGYRGVVVEKQAPPPAAVAQPDQEVIDVDQDQAEEEQVPLGALEAKAEFDELVVWGHETVADAASDPYVRIEEWTALAEQIHSYPVVEKNS